jgi:hypothetical protein
MSNRGGTDRENAAKRRHDACDLRDMNRCTDIAGLRCPNFARWYSVQDACAIQRIACRFDTGIRNNETLL